MALLRDFPTDPHVILEPAVRWAPSRESLRKEGGHKLYPTLVPMLRQKVKEFRDGGYAGANEVSRALLNWWFVEPHLIEHARGPSTEFQYFFAQREAMETIIYLHDVAGVRDKYDLIKFDASGKISPAQIDESWRRFVIKMATGSGKTKVLSLVLAWSFFCKTYDESCDLSRNFLLITPNIIVLDRIFKDFAGLRIFLQSDPVVPDNGYQGRNWRDDFQLTVHRQDDVRSVRETGNIFLTNIHRVYAGDESIPSPDDENTMDYFLGPRPTGKTTDSRADLGLIVRDINELMVLNDEAHHVHDPEMAWFKSIQDIHNKLLQKGAALSMQVDVSATPRRENGEIFPQTISDYPLVEAIRQDVVKHPVLPDEESRRKLKERQTSKFTEKYADYIDLGVVEWRKAYELHQKRGKKAVLFVMTTDTKNCDEVAAYLGKYPDLKDAVLVIHTKNNGEYYESNSGKSREELDKLRKEANDIDNDASPHKAIVSVMVLKEGWDVRNVTTIVGLRPYGAEAKILPEQTLGRGLRKMYGGAEREYLSVVGTDKFMEFVESIREEGVELGYRRMGGQGPDPMTLVIEVDREKSEERLAELEIEIPLLSPRLHRDYESLASLDVSKLIDKPLEYRQFTAEEQREIVFWDVATETVSHTTVLDGATVADYRSVLGYFAQLLIRELRLVSGYDVIYGKLKAFVADYLFGKHVDLENVNTLRNLGELEATKLIFEAFKKGINAVTVKIKPSAAAPETIKLLNVRPFIVKDQPYVVAKKCVFNRVIGDGGLELEFAGLLEKWDDVAAYTKNFLAVGFKLDYQKENGEISNYIPDFIVRTTDGGLVIVETKGQQDVDVEPKMQRLQQWCEDVNKAVPGAKWDFIYVDEKSFMKFKDKLTSFAVVLKSFREFKTSSS